MAQNVLCGVFCCSHTVHCMEEGHKAVEYQLLIRDKQWLGCKKSLVFTLLNLRAMSLCSQKAIHSE